MSLTVTQTLRMTNWQTHDRWPQTGGAILRTTEKKEETELCNRKSDESIVRRR